ncbi:hypothetical protein NXT08_14805 [Rhodococcus pyridinivorans]|uniref:Uncharacterized protein n=2 Tax=Rhodococcus pyridinivorans TaxID=103816 RepID=A0A7M2XVG4_9NOCA|nr:MULTISPECIES: hypothetical protein [Rhodococcus]EHK81067.1 hypothetical protein AK37_21406 [Rhodococcus pyridinivorans AK37]MCD5422266.1 hypothetical protein [Rhodococcus pyridinivorans]QOW01759.1 hypothetical protein INP59_25745 [Rhodococcus pyridinivorans]QXU53508.1 hypothetical protein KXC42_22680 [Rhodococcus sp. LW-XY12]USI92793.1 hypothetical protein LLA01_23880 [Rhodococcus pyridinivorans]
MIPVLCLLLYAAAVAVFGPVVLARLTAAGIAPRLGVAAWLSAITGVSVAATAAVAIALVDVLGRGGDAARWIVDCVGALSTSVGEHSGADMRLLSGIVLSGGRPWGSSGRGGSAGVCSAAEPAPMSTPTWPGWSDVASPISTQW